MRGQGDVCPFAYEVALPLPQLFVLQPLVDGEAVERTKSEKKIPYTKPGGCLSAPGPTR